MPVKQISHGLIKSLAKSLCLQCCLGTTCISSSSDDIKCKVKIKEGSRLYQCIMRTFLLRLFLCPYGFQIQHVKIDRWSCQMLGIFCVVFQCITNLNNALKINISMILIVKHNVLYIMIQYLKSFFVIFIQQDSLCLYE